MPRYTTGESRIAARERENQKKALAEKFGLEAITKAYNRLCVNCKPTFHCLLYPLTSEGEDCPYHNPKDGGLNYASKY